MWEGAQAFPGARGLPPVMVFTDPRAPDPRLGLWPGRVAVVFRHFGAPGREAVARELRAATRERGHALLIGADPELADAVGADGVHFPRAATPAEIARVRAAHPDWWLTQAAPRGAGSAMSDALDAAVVSPVFESDSPSAGTPLGVGGLMDRARALALPVYALGGVHAGNIHRLPPGLAGIAGVSFLPPETTHMGTSMTDDLTIEKHVNGPDIRFTATHPDFEGMEAELDLKGAGPDEYAATHTGVPRAMEGKGVGSALYRAMVADAREQGYRVIPVCPFIVAKAKRDRTAGDIFKARR